MVAPAQHPERATVRRWIGVAATLAAFASLVLLGVRSWRIDYPYSIDFQVYWLAGTRVASGDADALYEPGGGSGTGVPLEMAAYEFKNLPIVSLAFVPFAALDYENAKRVFWWISFGALLASAVVVGRFVLPAILGRAWVRVAWAVALVCSLAPAHTSLRHGQTTPLVLLALTAYLACALRRRSLPSGVFLAVAGAVKLPVLLLGGLEALRGRYRTVTAWLVSIGAIGAVSVAVFGAGLHREYATGLSLHAGTVMTGHNNQSIGAVVARLLGPAPVYDWEPRPVPPGALLAGAVVTVVLGGLLLWGLFRRRARGESDRLLLDFPAVLAFGIVVMPVAWDHYFLLLAPALATLALGLHDRGLLTRPVFASAFAVAFLSIAVPTPQWVLDGASDWGLPGSLLLSHYFLGAGLVLALATAGQGRVRANAA